MQAIKHLVSKTYKSKIKAIQKRIGVDYAIPIFSVRNFYKQTAVSVDKCVRFINKCVKNERKKKQKVTKGEIILLFVLILVFWSLVGFEIAALTSFLGIVTSLLMHSRK